MPSADISINSNGKEIKIKVCYLEETHWVYIPETTYIKYKEELDEFFSSPKQSSEKNNELKEKDAVDEEINTNNVKKMEDIQEKEKTRDLVTSISEDTHTVALMDKFEGLDGEKPYERLILKHALCTIIGENFEMLDLVIERSRNRDFQGDITFTELKKGFTSDLVKYIQNQFTEQDVQRCIETGEIHLFSKPYLLRAQNSRNRRGYGWEWDWTNPYSPSVVEGTFYGETTNYVLVGAYIREW